MVCFCFFLSHARIICHVTPICWFVRTDLEWKLVYVGSAENEQYDQELEDVFVGPVNVGTNQFVFQVCFRPHAEG